MNDPTSGHAKRLGLGLYPPPKCERCGNARGVQTHNAMTAYARYDGEPDPNPDVTLCPKCWAEYQDYWNEMWNEWRSSL